MQTNMPTITGIFDYVVEVSGEFLYGQNQVFTLKKNTSNPILLMVISATEKKAYCLVKGDLNEIKIGDELVLSTTDNKIVTYKNYFGSIIDISGDIIYTEREFENEDSYEHQNHIFNKPNQLLDYMPLTDQLDTGCMAIDLLIPIGKGQRELIIGDRQTGKTHIALNTIINQRNKNVKCIYVAIGQPHSQIANVYKTLKDNKALDYTIIIDASSNSPYDQFLAPYVGMAHAENISYKDDVLIIFDSLTAHANIYREIALLTNKPVGKEAFPGDMFFAHSRLLERSGKFKNRYSITALPVLQTVENDITSLVASNVISITDGQIVTNSELFAAGKVPAIDIDLSVSRIGGNVQKQHIASVAKIIGKIYRAYKRQTKLSSLKYDLNEETSMLITNGMLIEEMFIQRGISVYSDKTLYLTSKLISWGVLKGIKNIQQVLKFYNLFVEYDSNAKLNYQYLYTNAASDEENIKNYFAYALYDYARQTNTPINITINDSQKFPPLKRETVDIIYQQMKEGI